MLTRIARLAGSPWLRTGMLALVLACCGYGLYSQWPQVTAGLSRLHWYLAALAFAAALAGGSCMMLGWRAVLADLGSPLHVIPAAKISFVSQLGKYLPGAVWSLAAQIELGHDLGVPRRRTAASFAVSLAITVGVGLGVAALALPLASPSTARHYWWVLAVVPVIAAGLCPPVLGRVIDRILVLARRQPLESRPTWGGLSRAVTWTVAGWILFGGQVWLVLTSLTGHGGDMLLATGGYALAFCLGLLLVVFPGGIGARDLILIAALAVVVPHGTAVAIAVVSRVITTGSDLTCGAVGLALSRAARRARHGHAAAARDVAGQAGEHSGALAARGRHRRAWPQLPAAASPLQAGSPPANPAESTAT
jgi:uncharacterized membrane protein YbhN (UPF0104 family)